MAFSYPIWNKITACIYKSGKSYGVKKDGLTEILIGTSASNSHEFAKVRTTHRKNDDGTRTYHLYIDDKLYKKATLKNKEIQIEKISNETQATTHDSLVGCVDFRHIKESL